MRTKPPWRETGLVGQRSGLGFRNNQSMNGSQFKVPVKIEEQTRV